jgi:C-terminal processing protease CtpA/Prc
MRFHISRRLALMLIVMQATLAAHADEPKGTFGFAARVDANGGLIPTLSAVLIQSVQPGLPAALAGIVAGDSIIEVQGVKVAGAKAREMADRMKKKPGESVVLKLSRKSGESYEVTLVAVAAKT